MPHPPWNTLILDLEQLFAPWNTYSLDLVTCIVAVFVLRELKPDKQRPLRGVLRLAVLLFIAWHVAVVATWIFTSMRGEHPAGIYYGLRSLMLDLVTCIVAVFVYRELKPDNERPLRGLLRLAVLLFIAWHVVILSIPLASMMPWVQ